MRKQNRNKIAKIVTSSILILTTTSLPSYALNESSVPELAKESENQKNQITNENRKLLVEQRTSPKPQPNARNNPRRKRIELQPDIKIDGQPPRPRTCQKRIWDPIRKRWIYVEVPCPLSDKSQTIK